MPELHKKQNDSPGVCMFFTLVCILAWSTSGSYTSMYADIQEVTSSHKSISIIIQNYFSCIHVGIVSYSSTLYFVGGSIEEAPGGFFNVSGILLCDGSLAWASRIAVFASGYLQTQLDFAAIFVLGMGHWRLKLNKHDLRPTFDAFFALHWLFCHLAYGSSELPGSGCR